MGEIGGGPFAFFPTTPCRQYDSRNTSPLANGVNLTVTLSGFPCGIPSTALAISVNITAFNITGAGGAGGVFKVDVVSPPTIAWIVYPPTEKIRGNAGVVATNGSGQIVVQVAQGAGSVDFTVDLNGYYYNGVSDFMPANDYFGIRGSKAGDGVIFAQNTSSGANAWGVEGVTSSAGTGSAGVHGTAAAASGQTFGVTGVTASVTADAAGVRGADATGSPTGVSLGLTSGVRGESRTGYGIAGLSRNRGVAGFAYDSGGSQVSFGFLGNPSYGALGSILANTTDSAGVWGGDAGATGITGRGSAGVRGESNTSFGVLGLSKYIGVVGSLYNNIGLIAEGFLGSSFGTAGGFPPPWGVFASGDFGATGAKHFVEPHPADPTKVILYSSLEGREVGTYFRGTARTVKGEAVIDVPEDFRMVTDSEGLTVQLTAVGAPPTMYVASRDLNRIVVRSEKDLQFDYLVHGVRRAFKGFEPVRSGMEFAPRSPEDRMPAYLTEDAKARLIANGTYNADATVNMQTADRVGWTRIWQEREEREKAAAAAAARAAEGDQKN